MVAVVDSMAAWAEATSAASLAAEVLAVGTAVSAASWRGIGAEVRLRAVLLLSPAHVRAPRVTAHQARRRYGRRSRRGVALELAECGPQIGDQIIAILDSD